MLNKKFLPILLLSALFVAAFADEDPDSEVLVLTKENFEDKLNAHEHILVKFYAPWCGHCKALAPEYEKAAKMLKEAGSDIILAKVDATVHADLASQHKIQGYPTLLFFKKGVKSEYNGGRTSDTIISWLKKKTGPPLTLIDSSDAFEKLKMDNKVLGVFFSTDESSSKHKVVSELAGKVDTEIGHVKDSALITQLGGKDGGFAIFRQFDDPMVAHEGDYTVEALESFLQQEKLPLVTVFSPDTAQVLFQSEIKIHVLAFSGKKSSEFETHMALLKVVAKELKGKCHFVMIDMDDEESLRVAEFFSVTKDDVPTFRVLDMKEDMLKYLPDKKEFTTEYISQFAQRVLKGEVKPHLKSAEEPKDWNDNPVKVLVSKTFKDRAIIKDKAVFIKFYAPWCGHCKAIAPVWDELGQAYEGNDDVVIAKLDATENELEDIRIGSFPTLKFSPKGSTEFIDYSGERKIEAFKQFVDSNGKDMKGGQEEEDEEEKHDEL